MQIMIKTHHNVYLKNRIFLSDKKPRKARCLFIYFCSSYVRGCHLIRAVQMIGRTITRFLLEISSQFSTIKVAHDFGLNCITHLWWCALQLLAVPPTHTNTLRQSAFRYPIHLLPRVPAPPNPHITTGHHICRSLLLIYPLESSRSHVLKISAAASLKLPDLRLFFISWRVFVRLFFAGTLIFFPSVFWKVKAR